jgi:hypothetical protein
VLLFISLLALVFGCLMLVLEWSRYEFQINPLANLRSAAPAVASNVQTA